jgi:uncharacterized DUF497 family protein
MKITWDEAKAEEVKAEHGVDFAQIIDVFSDILIQLSSLTRRIQPMKRRDMRSSD